MLKKILILFVALSLSLVALCSCEGLFGGGDDTPTPPSNKTVSFNKIIVNDTTLDLIELRRELSDIVGPIINVGTDATAISDGEIVLGESSRPITAAAKDALSSALSESSKYDCGYVIYSDGKNIAVYWQIDEMSTLAISKLISVCIHDKRLVLDSGIVAYEYFDKSEYESEKYWLALAAEAPADVVAAFKRAYSYYDGSKLVEWIANLYDAEIGGFYYSNSARDYAPYLPDIESTSFALSQIIGNGALTNRNTQLPLEMQIAMVDFMKNMQSAEDGYFYHPQWPQDKAQLQGDRYGRDVASAASFITSFYIDRDGDGVKEQQRPTYCAPGTSKCAKHVNTDERCSFPISTAYITSEFTYAVPVTLTVSHTDAVLKVTNSIVAPTASVSSTPNYSSAEAFREWLIAYNAGAKDNSGNAHAIAERRMEIIDHGYMDIVLDYLDDLLEEVYNDQISAGETPSGAFQYDANFRAVWGIYKYLCLYNLEGYGRKIDIKYVPYMVDTCIKVIGMPAEDVYHVNDVMNQWTAISRIITNVETHYGKEEANKIIARVRENAVYLIDNTLEKIAPFRIGDGSFAYTMNGCSLSVIYGVEISLGLNEGDLNSTVLATGTYKAMYTTMGYDVVNICTPEDGQRFLKAIEELEPITKKEQVKQIIDFETDASLNKVSLTKNTEQGKIVLRDDPEGIYEQSLYFESGTADARADSISFGVAAAGSGCNVLDVDMYVLSDTDDGYLFQISVGSSCYFAMYKSGRSIRLVAVPHYNDGHENLGVTVLSGISVDEWFNLRIEYYVPDGENLTVPITKVFLDGEFVTYTTMYVNANVGAVPTNVYGSATFYSMRRVNTYVYFDNCYFAKETKIFSETDHTIIK